MEGTPGDRTSEPVSVREAVPWLVEGEITPLFEILFFPRGLPPGLRGTTCACCEAHVGEDGAAFVLLDRAVKLAGAMPTVAAVVFHSERAAHDHLDELLTRGYLRPVEGEPA